MRFFASILLASILLFSFGLYFNNISTELAQDLGRHITIGKIIWQSGHVPQTNLFSYTNPNFKFINTHWLSEVVFYLISLGSLTPLVILKVVTMSLALLMITISVFKSTKSILATGFGFIILSPILLERTEIRPEIFSYLFTAIFIYLIYQHLNNQESKVKLQLLWLLPVLEILWVNMHIYFIVGPILIFFLFLQGRQRLRRQYFILLLATTLATLINPHFFSGALYPLHIFDNYGYTIVENQSFYFLESLGSANPNIFYFKVALVGLVLSFCMADWRKIPTFNFLLASLVILPIMHIRSFPFLFFLQLPVIAYNFANPNRYFQDLYLKIHKRFSSVKIAEGIIIVSIILIRSFRLLSNEYYETQDIPRSTGAKIEESGRSASQFFLTEKIPGSMFNNFDIGGFLDYSIYPRQRVFIDNRPEAFPAKFISETYIPMQQSRQNFDAADKTYHFQSIFFTHTDSTPWGQAFLSQIITHPDWKLVYLDDYAVIFVRKDGSMKNLGEITEKNFVLPKTKNYLSYLYYGQVFGLFNWTNQQKIAFQTAFQLAPLSRSTNLAMASLYLNDPKSSFLADKYLQLTKTRQSLPLF